MPNSTSCGRERRRRRTTSAPRGDGTRSAGRRRRSPTARRATARSCARATARRAGRTAACRAGCWATRSPTAGRGRRGQVARRHLDRRRRFAGVRLRRRPELERALVRLVRLREPQRHVQRERELEQHQRDLAIARRAAPGSGAARGSDRSPRRARTPGGRGRRRSSGTRPPCPRRRRRASGGRAGRRPRPRARRTAPPATPPPRGAGGSDRPSTSVRYAASWISACLKRYSGSGHRRPSRTRSSRISSSSDCRTSPSSAPTTASSSGSAELPAEDRRGHQRLARARVAAGRCARG